MPQPDRQDQNPQSLPAGVVEEILRYQSKLSRAERLLETVNDAARAVRIPFTTFLLLGTYIGVIIASTTDKQLLRISPVTLPLLNVELPILGFYLFTPWLFLLIHFNLLLYLALLERQLRQFEEFVTDLPEAPILRRRLYNFPFIHMLIGHQYDRFMQLVLALIVWITVIALPLGLLLWAQIAFLPYHDPDITWGQRLAVMLDATILVLLWARIVSSKSALQWWAARCRRGWAWLAWLLALPWAGIRRALRRSGKAPRRPWIASADVQVEGSGAGFLLSTALAAVLVSLLIATVPDEAWEKALLARLPQTWIYQDSVNERRFLWPTYALFEVEGALLSRNLKLHEQILTVNDLPARVINILREGQTQERNQALQEVLGINLQGRDLRYARLSNTIIPKADLRGATLQDADLRWAQLQRSDLREAQLQGADLRRADLQGVDLRWANMQDTDLAWTNLQGATLDDAQLAGANLRGAQLQGATLRWADLRGADLRVAQLQRANLHGVWLQGADLGSADLRGADLRDAQLQNADLSGADLQGADLRVAQLQGASLHGGRLRWADLREARLQGVDLGGAQMQGADLRRAKLQGADLRRTQLQAADLAWADLQGADLRRAFIGGANFELARVDLADLRGLDRTGLAAEQYQVLSETLQDQIDDAERRTHLLERLRAAISQKDTLEAAQYAISCLGDEPQPLVSCIGEDRLREYHTALASYLVELACSDMDVAHGVARRVINAKANDIGTALLRSDCSQNMANQKKHEPTR